MAERKASSVLKFKAGMQPVIPDFDASMSISVFETKNIGAIIIGWSIPSMSHSDGVMEFDSFILWCGFPF